MFLYQVSLLLASLVAGNEKAAVSYINVEGSGSYGKVTNINPGVWGKPCPDDKCVQKDCAVSGPMAPFSEELTMVFRGPMLVRDAGVYSRQGGGGVWGRESH